MRNFMKYFLVPVFLLSAVIYLGAVIIHFCLS